MWPVSCGSAATGTSISSSESVLRVHAQGMRTHCTDQRDLDGDRARSGLRGCCCGIALSALAGSAHGLGRWNPGPSICPAHCAVVWHRPENNRSVPPFGARQRPVWSVESGGGTVGGFCEEFADQGAFGVGVEVHVCPPPGGEGPFQVDVSGAGGRVGSQPVS
jgi:hypothetical protein